MNDEFAERVLTSVMGREDTTTLQTVVADLQALARLKYDGYGMYRPGVKFLERLVGWLRQFDEDDRRIALDFVRRHLIFISFAEMDHLVQCVYPDFIKPRLVERIARETSASRFRVSELSRSGRFAELVRRTLILGLSDGARLDQLRRSSPRLSTEQFHPSYLIEHGVMQSRQSALRTALDRLGSDADATFEQIILVDDFSGSGFSMLRRQDGVFDGKLARLRDSLPALREFFAPELEVFIILYVASAQARDHILDVMNEADIDWPLSVVMPFDADLPLTGDAIAAMCEKYYDPALDDDIKGRVPLGFEECALPVVLHHNAPNNSICLLWGDTTDDADGRPLRALFPRYERHHEARP